MFAPGQTEIVVPIAVERDLYLGGAIEFVVGWTGNTPAVAGASGFIRGAAVGSPVADLPQPVYPPVAREAGRKPTVSSNFMEPIAPDGRAGAWRSRMAWGRVQASNGELGVMTDVSTDFGVNPFPIVDGKRVIRAEYRPAGVKDGGKVYDYSSPLIMSDGLYSVGGRGYVELRAKIDRAQGSTPAFWLLPFPYSWPPEIDLFESGLNDNPNLASTIHDARFGMDGFVSSLNIADGQWHVYGFDMTDQWMVTLVDGREIARRPMIWPASQRWQIVLNVAVGGLSPAPKAPTAGWKSEMTLDYLRLWE